MSEQFRFTDPGEGLQEGEVIEVLVHQGDHVDDGDMVLTVETAKAATEIPAPFTGTVEKVHVSEGDVVHVDDVLISYEPDGGGDAKAKQGEDDDRQAANRKDADTGNSDAETETSDRRAASDRETADDDRSEASGKTNSQDDQEDRQQPVPAAPAARRLAREKGINLHEVEPSGPDGRVLKEDINAAAGARESEGSASESSDSRKAADRNPFSPAAPPSPLPDFSRYGRTERQPLRSVRRVTAQRMAQSWSEIPHVFHNDVADITELDHWRGEYAEEAEAEGGKLTPTVLVIKAVVAALKHYPRFNASLDVVNEEIVLKHYCHIGVAVATEHGLLVPVIRDADRKSVVELTAEVARIAARAREGDLSAEEMQGASFTVTNPGPMGGTSLTPLINPPEAAILGLGQARLEPVVTGDLDDYEIRPRLRLPLCLGFDHRLNDGADAARFVTSIVEYLGDPRSLLLQS